MRVMAKELKCPICREYLEECGDGTWVCDSHTCVMDGEPLSSIAFMALNAKLAKAEKLRRELHDYCRKWKAWAVDADASGNSITSYALTSVVNVIRLVTNRSE